MAGKRVSLELIPNETTRRNTFRRRREGILKKVSQLSILCGVNALAIIYGPYDPIPVFWPPSPTDAKDVLDRFRSLSEFQQSKQMMSQEDFLREWIRKLKKKLESQVKENQELETTNLMNECLAGKKDLQDLSLEALGDLTWKIERKMKAIRNRMNELLKATPTASTLSLQQFIPMPMDHERSNTVVDYGGVEASGGENMAMEPLHGQQASMNMPVTRDFFH